MNIKQIAALTGKTPSTIQRWIDKGAESGDLLMQNAKALMQNAKATHEPADFTLEQTLGIVRAGGNETLAKLLEENAKQSTTVPALQQKGETRITAKGLEQLAGVIARAASEAAVAAVAPVIDELKEEIRSLKDGTSRVVQLLPAPEKSDRAYLNELVRTAVKEIPGLDYQIAWRKVYREVLYRESIDLGKRAESTGRKKIDIAEEMGLIPGMIAIAKGLWPEILQGVAS